MKALGTRAQIAYHSSEERRVRRSFCSSMRKGPCCAGGSRKAFLSLEANRKVATRETETTVVRQWKEGSGTDYHILVLKLFFLHEKLCNLRGKLRPYNIENHLVATHSCQQMRNSFLPVPWEEEPPEQVLQLHSLAGRGHDKLSCEKTVELHRKSLQRPGAWELNGCSRSGPLPPGKWREGREGREALWSFRQSSESKRTSKDKIQSKHVLVPASLLS